MRWRGLTRSRSTGPPIARLLALSDLPPVADFPGEKARFPGSSASGVAPGWSSFSVVREFLLPGARRHKGFRPAISRFFGHPQDIHTTPAVIPRAACLSTGSSTTGSTDTPQGARAGYPRPVASGTEHVSRQIFDYAVAHSSPPDALLRDLIEETAARFPGQVILQIGPEQGTFMTLLSRLIAPRR